MKKNRIALCFSRLKARILVVWPAEPNDTFAETVMPKIRIYRARIDIGDEISGLVFSYDPITSADAQIEGKPVRLWQIERFYVETPDEYELSVVNGQKFVRDPRAGDNVYMRAARVVSRVWQNEPGFHIIPSTYYASLDAAPAT